MCKLQQQDTAHCCREGVSFRQGAAGLSFVQVARRCTQHSTKMRTAGRRNLLEAKRQRSGCTFVQSQAELATLHGFVQKCPLDGITPCAHYSCSLGRRRSLKRAADSRGRRLRSSVCGDDCGRLFLRRLRSSVQAISWIPAQILSENLVRGAENYIRFCDSARSRYH